MKNKIRFCPFCNKENKRHHYLKCKNRPNKLNNEKLKYEYIKYNFKYISKKDNLYKEYVINRKSLTDLKKEFKIDFKSVIFLLDYFNIKKRSIKDSSDIMLKHSKKTFNKKYGIDNPWEKNAIGYNTRIKNLNDKYGIDNVFQKKDVIEKIKNSNINGGFEKKNKTMLKRYGITSPFQDPKIHKKALLNSGKRITKLNNMIYDIFDKNEIKYEKEYFIQNGIKKYFYDVKVEDILIEINGDYWHANPEKYDKAWYNRQKKQTALEIWNNDKIKRDIAIENGYKFITIWESEIKNNIGKLDEYIKNKIYKENNRNK